MERTNPKGIFADHNTEARFRTEKLGGVPLANGRAARGDARSGLASRSSVGALAASEAGRAARCGVAQVRNAEALNDFGIALCDTRRLTFEITGMTRLAGACPVD